MKNILILFLFISATSFSQKFHAMEGRWDLEMEFQGKTVPSWLEIRHSGHQTLIGRFVFAFGSARPISEIKFEKDNFTFSIPGQWEPEGLDMVFHGVYMNDQLKGTMVYTDGSQVNWTGVRAGKVPFIQNPKLGQPIALFNGKDLDGWHADKEKNQWVVKDGILTSPESGANLITDQKFENFKLEAEFRFPENGNSGIYLRGRYEVQIADNMGLPASDIYFGGIYGFLEPNENRAGAAGEWQDYEITLNGQRVTIKANGKTIISDTTIPGITGGALDSNEGLPGPIMLQGDHAPIEFRKLVLTPLE